MESHKHMSEELVSEIKLPLADKSGRSHRLHQGCTSLPQYFIARTRCIGFPRASQAAARSFMVIPSKVCKLSSSNSCSAPCQNNL